MNIRLIQDAAIRREFNELQRNHDDPLFRFLVTNILHHEPIWNGDEYYAKTVWRAANKAAGILEAWSNFTRNDGVLDETHRWSTKGKNNSKALQNAFFWMCENRFKEGKMLDPLRNQLGPRNVTLGELLQEARDR